MEVIKNECISKLEVVRILQKAYTEGRIQAKDGLVSILDDINATDVHPVRRGKWELTNNPSFRKCSECGAWWDLDLADNIFTNYCPNCGADMRGEGNA